MSKKKKTLIFLVIFLLIVFFFPKFCGSGNLDGGVSAEICKCFGIKQITMVAGLCYGIPYGCETIYVVNGDLNK